MATNKSTHLKKKSNKRYIYWFLILVTIIASFLYFKYGLDKLENDNISFSIESKLSEKQQLQVRGIIDNRLSNKPEDIKSIQQSINSLPWVGTSWIRKSIAVYRVYVEIYSPIGVLNDKWFLSLNGKRKKISSDTGYTHLTNFYFLQQKQKILFPKSLEVIKTLKEHNIDIKTIRVSPVGNWSVETFNNVSIHFGIKSINDKIGILIKALPFIRERGTPMRIDLRRKKGVAVRYLTNKNNLGDKSP